jgi:hypothetical protein
MNYKDILDNIGNRFLDLILNSPDSYKIPTEDFGWVNHRYTSSIYRMAHVERYSDEKIEVLHVTTFPHHYSPEPIFGFDVITTSDTITGCYMDFSPIIKTYEFDEGVDFKNRKPLPPWATVFSDRFILIKPDTAEELISFSYWVLNKYSWYLNDVLTKHEVADVFEVVEKQNTYCDVQASNPRTYNALKSKIGEEAASYFMKEILFPKID